MRKLLTISLALAMALAFVISSAALAQQKAAPAAKAEMKTAEGKISVVDAKARSFTVDVGATPMTFHWHKGTKIMESGHAVKTSALVAGADVTVKYYEKVGKNLAKQIIIAAPQAPVKQK
jgi:hypothetical protein